MEVRNVDVRRESKQRGKWIGRVSVLYRSGVVGGGDEGVQQSCRAECATCSMGCDNSAKSRRTLIDLGHMHNLTCKHHAYLEGTPKIYFQLSLWKKSI